MTACPAPKILTDRPALVGSGPRPGVLEISRRCKSWAASFSYCLPNRHAKNGIEYIFELDRAIFIYGLMNYRSGLSPHEQLALALDLGTKPKNIVGGHLKWEKSSKTLYTTEQTGHYHELWTPSHKARFLLSLGELLSTCGVTHAHAHNF